MSSDPTDPAQALATGPHPPAGAPPCRRLHVVDDDALSRKHLRTVLGFHGYEVAVSDGPAQARVAMLADPPDLVLMDLQMPGESGYSLLAWMQQQPTLQRVPVICVTASVPLTERERVRSAGFAAFVPKPITPPQRILDAVQGALAAKA